LSERVKAVPQADRQPVIVYTSPNVAGAVSLVSLSVPSTGRRQQRAIAAGIRPRHRAPEILNVSEGAK